MKKVIHISLLLLLISLLVSCKSINANENNDIKISEKSEKVITEYLDNNTDDIDISEENQKCYTAFEVLEIRDNKIYLWVKKEAIASISLPVVLNVENADDELIINSHEFPGGYGADYSDNLKKLFPKGILPESEEERDIMNRLGKIIKDKKSLDQG